MKVTGGLHTLARDPELSRQPVAGDETITAAILEQSPRRRYTPNITIHSYPLHELEPALTAALITGAQ